MRSSCYRWPCNRPFDDPALCCCSVSCMVSARVKRRVRADKVRISTSYDYELVLRHGAHISVVELLLATEICCFFTAFLRGWPVNIQIESLSKIVGERVSVGYIIFLFAIVVVIPVQIIDSFRVVRNTLIREIEDNGLRRKKFVGIIKGLC